MSASDRNNVIIGILGYGNRLPSLNAFHSLIENQLVSKLAIFWNQPGADVRKALDKIRTLIPNINITISEDNLGSAGGYARLIENFRDRETAAFFLLLDDDLRLASDCIENLVKAAELHLESLDSTLFLANRPKLPELANLIGKQKGIMRPRPGCCVGFHFFNLFLL